MSKESKPKKLEEMTQEELELLVGALTCTERMIQGYLQPHIEAIERLFTSLQEIQAYKVKVVSQRVREC